MLILPIIFVLLLTVIFLWRQRSIVWGEALLLACVATGVLAVVSVEFLGFLHIFTTVSVCVLWGVAVLMAAAVLFWVSRFRPFTPVSGRFVSLTVFEWACALVLLIVLGLSALVAFVSPPNNWDSMTYHLPRIMHWTHQASSANFITDNTRQNWCAPGAEYFLWHIFLLTKTDQWFNLLQWLALTGCVAAGVLLARALGASRSGMWLAAVVAATVPMAILQASSTQTDLIEAFWLVAAVLFIVKCRFQWSWVWLMASAGALALAVLTKGTFFIALPVFVWALATAPVAWRRKIAALGFVVLVIVLVNGPFWARSSHVGDKVGFLVQTTRPSAIFLNALRHAAVHLTLPTRQDLLPLRQAFKGLHSFLGEDSNGPTGVTFSPGDPMNYSMARDEDYAGNLVHFLLCAVMIVVVFIVDKPWRWYVTGVLMGSAIFMGMLWQPWVSRMHLPVFILLAPAVGAWLGDKGVGRWLVLGVVFVSALFFLLANQTRPLVGVNRLMTMDRQMYYFMKKPGSVRPYAQAVAIIRSSGCRFVGLIQGGDSWEYPLWALTGFGKVKFRAMAKGVSPTACLVVTLDMPLDEVIEKHGFVYKRVWQDPPLQIYAPVGKKTL